MKYHVRVTEKKSGNSFVADFKTPELAREYAQFVNGYKHKGRFALIAEVVK